MKVVGQIFKAARQIEPYYNYQNYDSIQNQGKNWSTFKTFPMHINTERKWTLFPLLRDILTPLNLFTLQTLIFGEKFAELLQGYKEL